MPAFSTDWSAVARKRIHVGSSALASPSDTCPGPQGANRWLRAEVGGAERDYSLLKRTSRRASTQE